MQGYKVTINGTCEKYVEPEVKCPLNCLVCGADGVCLKCKYTYQLLQSNQCVRKIAEISPGQLLPDCLAIISPKICQICEQGFAYDSSSGYCDAYKDGRCTVPNCVSCDGRNNCQTCQ